MYYVLSHLVEKELSPEQSILLDKAKCEHTKFLVFESKSKYKKKKKIGRKKVMQKKKSLASKQDLKAQFEKEKDMRQKMQNKKDDPPARFRYYWRYMYEVMGTDSFEEFMDAIGDTLSIDQMQYLFLTEPLVAPFEKKEVITISPSSDDGEASAQKKVVKKPKKKKNAQRQKVPEDAEAPAVRALSAYIRYARENDPGKLVVNKDGYKKIEFKNPNPNWIKSSRSNSSGYRNVSYEASSGKWRLKVSKCAQMLR